MSEVNVNHWKGKKFYEPTHAAYLWLDMEPQERECSVAVKDTYQDLIRNVPITIIDPDGEETRIEVVKNKRQNLLKGLVNEPMAHRLATYTRHWLHSAPSNGWKRFFRRLLWFFSGNSVIGEKKSNLYPYWGFKRDDLLAYAKEIGIRPLFLFPEDLNEANNLNKKQDGSQGISESTPKDESPNQDSTEEANIKNFISNINTQYPEATSKDIISHCFDCYKNNTRKKGQIKKIIDTLGIKPSGPGKRTQQSIAYMKNAPIYKPTQ